MHYHKGFTLIEMLVAVGLFIVIMTLALGALLTLIAADRRAEDLQSSIDNVSFALDSISRAIRTGSNYHCGYPSVTFNTIKGNTQDCSSTGATYFAFIASDDSLVEYQLGTNSVPCTAQACSIYQQITPVNGQPSGFLPMTSPNVLINNGSPIFYVVGSTLGDTLQPKVTILIHGSVLGSATPNAVFNLQTSVTQRLYDK